MKMVAKGSRIKIGGPCGVSYAAIGVLAAVILLSHFAAGQPQRFSRADEVIE